MRFHNQQVDVGTLPQLSDVIFQGLEKAYLNVLLLRLSLFSLVLIISLVGLYIFQPLEDVVGFGYMAALGMGILYVIWRYIVVVNGFRNKAYALRSKDIVYKTGWLWKSTTTTPFNRVQHISIEQGPVERKWNLSRLRLFTAGGSTSDLSIPGIDHNTAQELKEYIAGKTRIAENEEE